ncbi:hypothetical protein, partial [Streptomyces sp. STR69]|uniref:hypothetical protein n=1 Tax=Streptomyces sp. STR69 TaxID=1796942 RepID=UPI0021C8E886
KQQPKKSGPSKSGTSGGKTDKTGKASKAGKADRTDKGKKPAPGATTTTTTTAPASPYIAPTGNAVPTPGDGNCLLYAVIGSAPHLVRSHLRQAAPAIAAGTAAWLAR